MLAYNNLGIAEPHHGMTHNLQVEGNSANLVKINTFHVSLFAEFLERMKKTPDGDGSARSHVPALRQRHERRTRALAAEHSDGPGRRLDAGLKGNRHVAAPQNTPFANMLLTIANKFDCDLKSFGTLSKGEVDIA